MHAYYSIQNIPSPPSSLNPMVINNSDDNSIPQMEVWLSSQYKNSLALHFTTTANTQQNHDELIRFVHELSKLESNWDGYSALPISQKVIEHVSRLINAIKLYPQLPDPEVSPKSNGTISVEWITRNGEAYIEIGNTRYSGYIKATDYKRPYFLEGNSDTIGAYTIFSIYSCLFSTSQPITPIKIKE